MQTSTSRWHDPQGALRAAGRSFDIPCESSAPMFLEIIFLHAWFLDYIEYSHYKTYIKVFQSCLNVTTEERRYVLDTPSGRNGVRGISGRMDHKVSHTFEIRVRNHVKYPPLPDACPALHHPRSVLPVGLNEFSISLSFSVDEGVDAVWTQEEQDEIRSYAARFVCVACICARLYDMDNQHYIVHA